MITGIVLLMAGYAMDFWVIDSFVWDISI